MANRLHHESTEQAPTICRECGNAGWIAGLLMSLGMAVASLPLASGRVSTDQLPNNGAKSETQNIDDLGQIESFDAQIKTGKFTEIEPLLAAYLKDHPNSWRAHYMRGYVCMRLRKLSDALNELSKSLELNVKNPEAHKDLGQVLSVVGRYEGAQRELEAARDLKPDSPEIRYDLSRVLAAQDKFAHARQELQVAIRLDPNYKEAYNALGFALDALGDDAAALASYQRAIQISQQQGVHFDPPYVNLSGFYSRRGHFDLALTYARKALEENPNSDAAFYQMGKTYRTLEDWPHAADALEHAVALKPYSSQYRYVLSQVYRKQGKVKESQEQMAIFEKLERQTSDLEIARQESQHATTSPRPNQNQ